MGSQTPKVLPPPWKRWCRSWRPSTGRGAPPPRTPRSWVTKYLGQVFTYDGGRLSHRYDALGLLAPLFRRHCEPMVAATTTLFRALRPAHAKAAAAAAAAGTEADAFGAALAAAAASPRSVADALRCMLPRLLRATVRLSSTLWANGAPQFVLASLCSPAIRPPPLGPPPAAAAASSSSSPPRRHAAPARAARPPAAPLLL